MVSGGAVIDFKDTVLALLLLIVKPGAYRAIVTFWVMAGNCVPFTCNGLKLNPEHSGIKGISGFVRAPPLQHSYLPRAGCYLRRCWGLGRYRPSAVVGDHNGAGLPP